MSDLTSPDNSGWSLVIYDETDSLQVLPVASDLVTVGRGLDNDIVLNAPEISRHHLRLRRQNERLVVEDLNTSNGTLVNGDRIVDPQVLESGDVITLGEIAIRVDGPKPPPPQSRVKTLIHPISTAEPATGTVISSNRAASVASAKPSTDAASSIPQTRPQRQSVSRRLIWIIAAGFFLIILIGAVIGFIGFSWYFADEPRLAVATTTSPAEPITLDIPQVLIIQGPGQDSSVLINQLVMLQAIASDPSGISRMELWINDKKVDEITSQLDQNALSMTAGFQWSSTIPGHYRLQIRAHNQKGFVGVAPTANVTVIGEPDTATPQPPPAFTMTPTSTITPLPPSPTSTPIPTITATSVPATSTLPRASLVINISALNVRAGPGTRYEVLGQIRQGSEPEIVGQANIGQGPWWQIRVSSLPGGFGWVSADSRFTAGRNTFDVPQVNPPPLPTATPTSTVEASPTPTVTPTTAMVIRAPAGKTLLIVSNRSLANQPARLTLSGGKSVGGGKEIDPPPNGEVQLVLEPDFYRAVWSAPWDSFAQGGDFTAIPGKVMIMWIVPEEGQTNIEIYDELVVSGPSA